MTDAPRRLFLSPPFQSGDEARYLQEVLDSNWLAPLGPAVDAFETEFAQVVGAAHAVALSSGTAALHLALVASGVGEGDEVATSTLTFAASAFAILYVGARPVFIDADVDSWNLDAGMLEDWLKSRAALGRLPKAVLAVHLYGQACDVDRLRSACERWGVHLMDDAAEALGTRYRGHPLGCYSRVAAWSFNGNKLVAASGGGMLTTSDGVLARRVRKLASQSREPASHYEHAELGFNYRMPSVVAAIGRAQIRSVEARVTARRAHFNAYRTALGGIPGVTFPSEAAWGRHSRWLTCCMIDRTVCRATREDVRRALEDENIESRPVWKPMHEQPVFRGYESVGGEVASRLFRDGLCLPSGTAMTTAERDRTISTVLAALA